jgi:Rieske Fe-S protein
LADDPEESAESATDPPPTRRRFLNVAIAGTASALGIAAAYPIGRFLSPIAGASAKSVELGKLDEFPVASSKAVQFGERIALVIRLADGSFRAFIALCTHLECVVHYSAERNRIECPCHSGVYSVDGENISGPPPRPLHALRVNLTGDTIVLSEG